MLSYTLVVFCMLKLFYFFVNIYFDNIKINVQIDIQHTFEMHKMFYSVAYSICIRGTLRISLDKGLGGLESRNFNGI